MLKINCINSRSFILLAKLSLSACRPQETKEVSVNLTSSARSIVSPTASVPNKIFLPILSAIQEQTKIPVLLPSYVPESDNPLDGKQS